MIPWRQSCYKVCPAQLDPGGHESGGIVQGQRFGEIRTETKKRDQSAGRANNTEIVFSSPNQVSTWFANARRRLKKENKMTWSPRTRGDDDDDDDMDDEDEKKDLRNSQQANQNR